MQKIKSITNMSKENEYNLKMKIIDIEQKLKEQNLKNINLTNKLQEQAKISKEQCESIAKVMITYMTKLHDIYNSEANKLKKKISNFENSLLNKCQKRTIKLQYSLKEEIGRAKCELATLKNEISTKTQENSQLKVSISNAQQEIEFINQKNKKLNSENTALNNKLTQKISGEQQVINI